MAGGESNPFPSLDLTNSDEVRMRTDVYVTLIVSFLRVSRDATITTPTRISGSSRQGNDANHFGFRPLEHIRAGS